MVCGPALASTTGSDCSPGQLLHRTCLGPQSWWWWWAAMHLALRSRPRLEARVPPRASFASCSMQYIVCSKVTMTGRTRRRSPMIAQCLVPGAVHNAHVHEYLKYVVPWASPIHPSDPPLRCAWSANVSQSPRQGSSCTYVHMFILNHQGDTSSSHHGTEHGHLKQGCRPAAGPVPGPVVARLLTTDTVPSVGRDGSPPLVATQTHPSTSPLAIGQT